MDTTIETALRERIYDTLHKNLGFPLDSNQTGILIAANEKREADGYQTVWLMDGKAIISANRTQIGRIESLIKDTDLSAASIISAFDNDGHETSQVMLYALVEKHFTPFKPDSRYTVRQLTQDDTEAFAVFQAACSDEDREKGEVGLGDEIIFGVLDGEKIVAAASTFDLWGFVDVGILTHPDYRKQGLGKAAVSAVCEHYLQRKDDSRLSWYRHATTNRGSGNIARGLNYQMFASIVYVKFSSNQ